MTYRHVRGEVERILLKMADEGLAELRGVGPQGQTFTADRDVLFDRIHNEGLLADGVPWLHTVSAVRSALGKK